MPIVQVGRRLALVRCAIRVRSPLPMGAPEDSEDEELRHLVGDLLLLAEREFRAAQEQIRRCRESEAARARLASARRAMDVAQRCATYLTLGLSPLA